MYLAIRPWEPCKVFFLDFSHLNFDCEILFLIDTNHWDTFSELLLLLLSSWVRVEDLYIYTHMSMYLLACQLFDILLVICFTIYDSQLTTDDSRFVWIILCPFSRTTQGEISIEFESRNVEKCNEFMELFIVTANGERIFSWDTLSISILAIFRIEICLFENALE